MKQAESIEEYIASCGQWETSLRILRAIMLSSGLEEAVKWGGPVYMTDGKNATGMAAFKSYVGIWFYQGALLADEGKKLICAQEGVTKALRQWRFSSPEEIVAEKELIRAYIDETISNIREGKEIKAEKNTPVEIPAELEALLDEDLLFREKFEALSLTNRRDYARYISEAKQEKTRLARLEKIAPMILQGIGMNDKYKK